MAVAGDAAAEQRVWPSAMWKRIFNIAERANFIADRPFLSESSLPANQVSPGQQQQQQQPHALPDDHDGSGPGGYFARQHGCEHAYLP